MTPPTPLSGSPAELPDDGATFSTDSFNGKMAYGRCMAKPDMTGERVAGKTIPIIGAFWHTLPMVNRQTCEISTAVRTVLIDVGGRTIGFFGAKPLDGLAEIIAKHGASEWKAPVKVEFKREISGRVKNKFRVREV